MADITESEVRQMIAVNLADESDIPAAKHREVENKIMDFVLQELKKTAKSKELLLETFTTDRNYSVSTGLSSGALISGVSVILMCKIANNGFSIGDEVTAPTPYPKDSGRTAAQGIGIQYNNVNNSTIKVMVSDQITIMKPYNSAPNAAADDMQMSGINMANWTLKLIVGYK